MKKLLVALCALLMLVPLMGCNQKMAGEDGGAAKPPDQNSAKPSQGGGQIQARPNTVN